jgi:uncharacterized protein
MNRIVVALGFIGVGLLASLLPQVSPVAAQTAAKPKAVAAGKGPAVGDPVPPAVAAAQLIKPPAGVRDLKWDELMPSDWNPRKAIDRLNLRNMSDNDPRANELLAEVRAEWDRAPVVKKLAGQKVRLPGYIVSLEGDGKGVREFLLVPYFGACIHVPPPPSNQVVHVFADKPVAEKLVYEPVWVTGVLELEQVDTALGSSGYQIRQASVGQYGVAASR